MLCGSKNIALCATTMGASQKFGKMPFIYLCSFFSEIGDDCVGCTNSRGGEIMRYRPLRTSVFGMLAFLSITAGAHSESQKIELGWTYIVPCERGLFPPETASQRLIAYLNLEAPNVNDIQDAAQECAIQSTAVATLAGIIADPTAAFPVFYQTFSDCMSYRAWTSAGLSVESKCDW